MSSKTVLITRPAQQATQLCEAIRQAGGKPILFPTLEIVDPPKSPQIDLEQASITIFTSANAVYKSSEFWPKWPKHLKIIAIGSATVRALESVGRKTDEFPTQSNSEGLLALPSLQQIAQQTILIFKGLGGRTLLQETLTQRGAHVIEAIVYQRKMPTGIQWQAEAVDMIISTSCESLKNLLAIVKQPWVLNTPLIVISERVANFAKQLGFKHKPIVASQANDAALVEAFIQWRAR